MRTTREHRYLSVKEFAGYYRYDEKTVRRALEDGELRTVRLRAGVRIDADAFEAGPRMPERPRARGRRAGH